MCCPDAQYCRALKCFELADWKYRLLDFVLLSGLPDRQALRLNYSFCGEELALAVPPRMSLEIHAIAASSQQVETHAFALE